MEDYLNRLTDYLLTQSWQIAVLVVVIAVINFALKNRSAHVRYLLWLVVLAKCLIPPLLTVPLAVLPAERSLTVFEPPILTATESDVDVSSPASASKPPLPIPTVQIAVEKPAKLTIRQWLGLVWIAGMVVFFFAAGTKALRTDLWLRRERKPLPAGLQTETSDLFSGLGVRISPKFWLVKGIGQPFVWGVLRGRIYLPANFVKVNSVEHRKGILGHEFSHIMHFDAEVNLLQTIAQAVFWFHPFVWWANKKIRAEREKCCDEMVIARLGTKAKEYSSAIVNILISEHESTRPVPSLAVAGPVKNIEERIKTMLRPGKKFYKRPSLIAATVVLLIAFLTVPTAIVLTARAAEDAIENEGESVKLLQQAAADGDIDQVKLLISKGADVNEKDNNGWTPLHSAAWYGRKDVAELLIAKGAKVNAMDGSGRTALHRASRRSEVVCELLLAKGANINARDKAGNTPLHYAVGYRHVGKDELELLLSKGAEVNARNDNGQTPLHLAAASTKPRYREVAPNFLMANGADVNAKDKNGYTPLHVSAGNDRRDIVELLLAKGAIIDEKTDDGLTALHRAAMLGHTQIAELLLWRIGRGNSALDSKDMRGCTPLHYASMSGSNDIVELLICNDADVNAKNVRGETPAHLAVVQNQKDTVKLLISKGVDVSTTQLAAYIGDLARVKSFIEKGVSVNAQDGYGLTPLHAAAATGQKEVAEFLVNKGTSVNAGVVAEGLGTPLHYAIDGGSKEVTELLISKGAIIDARNKNGETSLHFAAQRGHNDLAKLLIANKADVNAKARNDWTPLHFAADNGHEDIAALLIEGGADINVVTERTKETPLLCAARLGHKDVMKLLIDKGTDVSPLDDLLYWMCKHGHTDLAGFFIKKGANVNSDAWGDAPSLYAVWNNHPDVLQLLLDHGADPDAKDRWDWSLLHYTVDPVFRSLDMTRMLLDKGASGWTPFGWAVEYGLMETVELFIAKGADVNAKDNKGRTVLYAAAAWANKDMAEFLIAKGANVNIKDKDGKTPMSVAKEKGRNEIVELLRKHGAKE